MLGNGRRKGGSCGVVVAWAAACIWNCSRGLGMLMLLPATEVPASPKRRLGLTVSPQARLDVGLPWLASTEPWLSKSGRNPER